MKATIASKATITANAMPPVFSEHLIHVKLRLAVYSSVQTEQSAQGDTGGEVNTAAGTVSRACYHGSCLGLVDALPIIQGTVALTEQHSLLLDFFVVATLLLSIEE